MKVVYGGADIIRLDDMDVLEKIKSGLITPIAPIVESEMTEELELAWKTIFLNVFKQTLWDKQRDLLHYGSPHLARQELLTRFALSDGLSVMRSDSEGDRLRYLLKAWRVKNPKRGFHFLRTYLQMLYPNGFDIEQLWQETSKPYTKSLSTKEEAERKNTPHWLTSRVRISITDISEDGRQILQYISTIQSIIGARFVVDVTVKREFGNKNNPSQLMLASGFSGFNLASFNGKCKLPSFDSEISLTLGGRLIW